MALLNPPDILPEAMRFIVRALLVLPDSGVDRDELLALVAPRGLADAIGRIGTDSEDEATEPDDRTGGGVIAAASLDALRTLKIVSQDTGMVRLRLGAEPVWTRYDHVTATSFSQYLLLRIAALGDPSASLGESEGVMDLVQALQLFYGASSALEPFSRFDPVTHDGGSRGRAFRTLQETLIGQDRGLWPVYNAERWRSFRRWAAYLGLARIIGGGGIVPDASQALVALLPTGSVHSDIRQFVAWCAEQVPILDGGRLHGIHDPETDGDQAILSPGLSVTLRQLEAMGAIRLEKRSDTGGRTIRLAADGTLDRFVTNVAVLGPATPKRGRK